jgi:hypothetical protein
MEPDFELNVVAPAVGAANSLATSLERLLKGIDPSLEVVRSRSSTISMDMGATLAIVVGSAAATAIAQGIKGWLVRNQSGELILKKDGALELRNLRAESLERIASAVIKKKKET